MTWDVFVKVLRKLGACFPRSFVNTRLEFIADSRPRVNSYFLLADCKTELDVIAKMLEWLSRYACKSLHYRSDKWNDGVHKYHLNGINAYCGTAFTEDDMMLIYTYLGNACNHQKTIKFICSDYDLRCLLPEKETEE